MKILFINKFFHPNGGSETVFFQERNFFIKKGYKVIDFSMASKKNIPSPFSDYFVPHINYRDTGGITHKILQAVSFVHSSTAVKRIDQLLGGKKPDIAHLHNIYHQMTPSIIPILKKHGLKIILTLHDYKLVCPSYLALRNGNICEECKGGKFLKPFTTNCQDSYLHGLLLSIEALFHKWKGSYENIDLFWHPASLWRLR